MPSNQPQCSNQPPLGPSAQPPFPHSAPLLPLNPLNTTFFSHSRSGIYRVYYTALLYTSIPRQCCWWAAMGSGKRRKKTGDDVPRDGAVEAESPRNCSSLCHVLDTFSPSSHSQRRHQSRWSTWEEYIMTFGMTLDSDVTWWHNMMTHDDMIW